MEDNLIQVLTIHTITYVDASCSNSIPILTLRFTDTIVDFSPQVIFPGLDGFDIFHSISSLLLISM